MHPTFYQLRDNPSETLLSEHEVALTIQIAEAVRSAGGRALVVGGYPRDIVMHKVLGKRLETKDLDLEVYGMTLVELTGLIEPIHHINAVGASFGVLKVSTLDISLPRKDSKTGQGHRGFVVETDPLLNHAEAARRRDFTINTLALDPLTGELFDEHHGIDDIQRKILRAVDTETFGDDPLRALRAMQFAGRFHFTVESETLQLCRSFDLRELSPERVGEEWLKLLLKAAQPSLGLRAGLELGVIEQLHPELMALIGTIQEPEWHPEGDVWNHTLMAVDVAANIIRREQLGRDESITVMLGALTHDFGKPAVTARDSETGRIRSHEHASGGVPLAKNFMDLLCIPGKINQKVQNIVFDHMFLPAVMTAKDAAIRRLAKRLYPATVQELIWVTEADFYGRTLEHPNHALLQTFQKRADELAVSNAPLEPLIKGRDLLALGIRPGKEMGDILQQLESAQEDGAFTTHAEGIAYFKTHIQPKRS